MPQTRSSALRRPLCFPTLALFPYSESTNNPTGIGPTEDDVSLLWLKSSSDTDAAVKILEDNASATGIALGQIFYGPSLRINYNDPTVDPRTPDIIVTPNVGVTYTGSHQNMEEHGGFAHDDTNVMLLLSNQSFTTKDRSAERWHGTGGANDSASAGIDPSLLKGVRLEGTDALPAVPLP